MTANINSNKEFKNFLILDSDELIRYCNEKIKRVIRICGMTESSRLNIKGRKTTAVRLTKKTSSGLPTREYK